MNHTITAEKSTDLIETHILPLVEDHAHWLIIYDQQDHCVKGLKATGNHLTSTFTRFYARCKICGGEDRWGVANPQWAVVSGVVERGSYTDTHPAFSGSTEEGAGLD